MSNSQRHKEDTAFQRKKLLIFAGLLGLISLVIWVNQVGEANIQNCISCQKQLSSNRPDSLVLIGDLRHPDSTYTTYHRTIRDPALLRRLVKLSEAGPALHLGITEHKSSANMIGFVLCWYTHDGTTCQFTVSQTKDGKPFTDCYGGYQFVANTRAIPVLDSLFKSPYDSK